jgi:hypothetical protein
MLAYKLCDRNVELRTTLRILASSEEQARRLIELNCGIPARDAERYSCVVDAEAQISDQFIHFEGVGVFLVKHRKPKDTAPPDGEAALRRSRFVAHAMPIRLRLARG